MLRLSLPTGLTGGHLGFTAEPEPPGRTTCTRTGGSLGRSPRRRYLVPSHLHAGAARPREIAMRSSRWARALGFLALASFGCSESPRSSLAAPEPLDPASPARPFGPPPDPTNPPPSGSVVAFEGRIAFASTREGASTPHVYVLEAGDTEPTRLAFGEAPAWSHDGQRIAFHTWPGGVRDAAPSEVHIVHIVEVDGSPEHFLVGDDAMYPAWSPDAKRLAFARDGDIFVVNADGSGEAALLRMETVRAALEWENPDLELSRPTWSPDGQRIAFIVGGTDGGGGWVLMVDADGSNPRSFDFNPMAGPTHGRPAWSPDGSRLAIGISGGMDPVPWLVSAASDGTDVRIYEWGRGPDWSPDGTKLVYHRSSDSANPVPTCCERIYLGDLTTGVFFEAPMVPPARNPANREYSDYDPAWSRTRE